MRRILAELAASSEIASSFSQARCPRQRDQRSQSAAEHAELVGPHSSSSRGGQPRHVKIVHAGGVAAGDLGLFVLRYPGQDLRQDFP
jgi:hypothetical protein